MKEINNMMLSIVLRYLYCGYELSSSKKDDELSSIMILKDNKTDHESVVYSIKDVFLMHIEDIMSAFPNILEKITDSCFLETWYWAGKFYCRIANEVSEGPYCENVRKETLDDLTVSADEFLMAMQDLDTMIAQHKEKAKEDSKTLKKIIPVEKGILENKQN